MGHRFIYCHGITHSIHSVRDDCFQTELPRNTWQKLPALPLRDINLGDKKFLRQQHKGENYVATTLGKPFVYSCDIQSNECIWSETAPIERINVPCEKGIDPSHDLTPYFGAAVKDHVTECYSDTYTRLNTHVLLGTDGTLWMWQKRKCWWIGLRFPLFPRKYTHHRSSIDFSKAILCATFVKFIALYGEANRRELKHRVISLWRLLPIFGHDLNHHAMLAFGAHMHPPHRLEMGEHVVEQRFAALSSEIGSSSNERKYAKKLGKSKITSLGAYVIVMLAKLVCRVPSRNDTEMLNRSA